MTESNEPVVASVRIPGEWRDAWLYREHLLLWTRENALLTLKVEDLVRSVAQRTDRSVATALEYVIFRNDWKVSEQFRKLRDIPGVAQGMRHALIAADGEVIVEAEGLNWQRVDREPTPGVLLDSEVYANRIYCASTEGLFESYLFPASTGEAYQEHILHGRIAHVSARYACVNASAEEEGLWYQPILFGHDRLLETPDPFERVADFSLSTSHVSRHLLNYADGSVPQFLRADARRSRLTENSEFEEWQVLGYEQPRDLAHAVRAALGSHEEIVVDEHRDLIADDDSSIQVLGNARYRLLIEWKDALRVLDVSAYPEKPVAVRPDKGFDALTAVPLRSADVLGTHAIGGGFLVETFDEVRMLTAFGSIRFFAGPAARIRTFGASLRYKEMAAVVDDTGVSLIGYLG